ncbi:MAG: hypothetical protein I4E98_08625 [Planktothrix agardhii KL2]|jgi:hypothetical protein|uniref:hypothetical protein n=1 Tax=Planktothrix agardhii TaxID=1160 RepID=UPI001A2EDDBF|nr:hypothetical protein [Planktothrix agardhii]MBG0746644.1 hypothetical protein [Planktothrix agardhii KL2]
MADKKPEWSDYAYDNNSISKRLGIEKDEVQKLKDEAATKSKKTVEGIVNPPGSVGAGIGGSIDINDLKKSYLRVGAKIPGLSVEFDTNGEGNIDIVNLIRVETIRIKCFYIQRFYLAGQFLFSDIQKVDSEECNGQQKDPPDPIPPDPPPQEDDFPPPPKKIILPIGRGAVFLNIHARGDGRLFEPGRPEIIIKDRIRSQLIATQKIVGGIFGWKIKVAYQNTGFGTQHSGNLIYTNWLSSTRIVGVINTFEGPITELRVISLPDREGWGSVLNGDFAAISSYANFLQSRPGYDPGSGNSQYQTYSSSYSVSLDILEYEPPKEPLDPPFRDTKMKDDCCEKSDKLLKRLAKYQGLGEKISPINVKDNKIEEKGNKDDNFPMKIPKRWIDREAKPKDDYEVKSMRHLILSVGIMLDRFEELFNPAGKDNGFPLKKPEEGLWKWLPGDGGDYEAPDPDYDPKKSKDDGKIKNKKLKIETYLDLFRYFLESQIRLELLFPIAQIRDSEISKRLIYPKAPGTIKINDLIQFQELMLLFINKTLGDPSGAVIIKDADPTQEGAQPITIENFDISDMLRKLLRFSVDINSDIDLTNNFSKRTLYQLLSAMQVLVKNHEMTEAIFEDLGMKEEQTFVPVKFFADPYAGVWESGKGFDPNKIKPENTEAGIEANLQSFLQEKEVEVKVSRRAKDETTDIRDLLAQIGRYAAELAAMGKIPNNPEAIQQAIDKARFELQTESALRRTDVRQASAAGRVRTKRNKPKGKQR